MLHSFLGWLLSQSLKKDTQHSEKQARRVEAQKKGDKQRICIHCRKSETENQTTLYTSNCGNAFHHVCAGKLGHENWKICLECAKVPNK
jgi:hypothetical protein